MPENLPDDPELLKQMLAKMQSRVGFLEEQVALLRQRLFGRQSEQAVDPATPQMALFNEAEHEVEPVDESAEEEAVSPAKRRGKRKPLPAHLPRIEIIHELPEHELTCVGGCRKHTIIHCDETRVQVLKETSRQPGSQSWMWVQTGGPPDKPVILFDYSTSRAQEVPVRLLEGYRGYLMTDDYAGYNALGAQDGVERLGC